MTQRPKNAVVPKFSSFKPKVRQQADAPRLIDKEDDSCTPRSTSREFRSNSVQQDKGHHHERTRHRHHRSSRHHQQHGVEHEENRYFHDGSAKNVPVSEDDIGLYFIDKTGDPDNLRYGRLHQYSVPEYRLFGRGNILGASRRPPDARGRMKVPPTNNASDAFELQKTSSSDRLDVESDFIDFEPQSWKRRETDDSATSTGESDGVDRYRSVGKRAAEVTGSLPYTLPSNEQPLVSDAGLEKRQHLAKLSRLAEEHPTDVERWTALIDYQDQMRSSSATKGEIRSLVDIKISIYEKALTKVGKHRNRDRLLAGLLEEGSKLWDYKKLAARWQNVLDENPDYMSLWVRYLDFQQTSFQAFSFEHCRATYLQVLEKVSRLSFSREADQIQFYVFLRFTLFLVSCGFSEQAIALWQSLLEYTFLKPQGCSRQGGLDLFSDFWESEVARIGEQDAKGWKCQDDSTTVDPKTDLLVEKLGSDHARLFDHWAKCESERVLQTRMPARMMDDVEEDDPYRVILWSDIKDLVFEPLTEIGRETLIGAFCKFCSLPPIGFESGVVLGWWSDPFLISEVTGSAWLHETRKLRATNTDEKFAKQRQHVFPITHMFPDLSTLFPSQDDQWFSLWTNILLRDDNGVPLNFKLRALRLLAYSLLSTDELVEYIVALQFQADQDEAKKLAKGLLKKRPNNLRLYNAYALTESRSGNKEAAERVWSTALSMSKTFPERDQEDSIILWQTWVWDAVDIRRFEKALRLLAAIPSGQVDVIMVNNLEPFMPTPLDILAAKQYLQSHLEHALSLRHYFPALAYTDLLALLTYLTNSDRTLDRVSDVYNTSFPPSAAESTIINSSLGEAASQSLARIIHLHATTAPIRQPKAILNHLSQLLKFHPTNTLLLSLYHHHSQHLILTDRIRSLVPGSLHHHNDRPSSDPTQTPSVIPALIPLTQELSRPSNFGSTQHSIRAAFESAVTTHPFSPFLWNLYLDWLIWLLSPPTSHHSTKLENAETSIRGEVKALIYRILRATPWTCKGLVLRVLGEESLSRLFAWEEKKALWEVLGEKGVRVHVDIADALEELE